MVMASTIRLKELKIKGFRGYGKEEKTIDLSGPVTLLYGGNRSGKSSTLNAIEWALYGKEVAGKKIGINERKGWQVRNLRCESARVELVLEADGGEIRVIRETGKVGKKTESSFYFTDPEGNEHLDEEVLWKLLGMDARDFMNTVYLHQEVIRDIVISEPSVRRDALNRLLGISELHNLSRSLGGIRSSKYEEEVDGVFRELQDFIRARSAAYQEMVERALEEGKRRGMDKDQFTEEGLRERCTKAAGLLSMLAEKAGVKGLEVTPLEDAAGFTAFREAMEAAVRRLRSENPGSTSRRALFEERDGLERALEDYRSSDRKKKTLLAEKSMLEGDGSLDALRERKGVLERELAQLDADLERINARLPVIEATVAYLEKLEDKTAATDCPSCEQRIVPAQVLDRLADVKAGMGEEAREKAEKKSRLSRDLASLRKTLERLEVLVGVEIPAVEKELRERRREIGRLVSHELAVEDDPEVVATRKLSEIEGKIEEAGRVIEEYEKKIWEIEEALREAVIIWDMLEARRRIEAISKVTGSPEWKSMEDVRARLIAELEALDKARKAVDAVMQELAEERLNSAGELVRQYYGILVERPDFESIAIDPADHEIYAVSGDQKEKIITFFNQGDMNCAALGIFLALGASGMRGTGAGFLILDDPSQSLDSTQKSRLAALIDLVAGERQVVIATMDGELLQALMKEVGKTKSLYCFGEWDPVTGPSIARG